MNELQQLNKDVFALGRVILTRKRTNNDNVKELEIKKFNFKNNLDKKEFSNDDKRELEAMNQPTIKSMIDDNKKYSFETEIMQLEYEYKLRELNILLTTVK